MGKYLAGLWSKGLPTTLLWEAKKPGFRNLSRLSPPTWSWASVARTRIQWMADYKTHRDGEPILECEMMHAFTVPATIDPRGKVSSGILALRGRLVPVSLEYHTIFGKHTIRLPTEIAQGLEYPDAWGCESFSPDTEIDVKHGPDYLPAGTIVQCMLVTSWNKNAGALLLRQLNASECSHYTSTLLAGEASSPLFKRIGMFWIYSPGMMPRQWRAWSDYVGSGKKQELRIV